VAVLLLVGPVYRWIYGRKSAFGREKI